MNQQSESKKKNQIKEPIRRRKRRNGFYGNGKDDPRDTDWLIALYHKLSRKRKHPITTSEYDQQLFVGCAEHAIRCGKPPLRLFRWMIGNWPDSLEMITCVDFDSAIERLREWRRKQEPELSGFCRDIVAKLAESWTQKEPKRPTRDEQLKRLAQLTINRKLKK